MRITTLFSLFAAITLLFTGCGPEAVNQARLDQQRQKHLGTDAASMIIGKWTQCRPDPEDASRSLLGTFEFSQNGVFSSVEEYYMDQSCTEAPTAEEMDRLNLKPLRQPDVGYHVGAEVYVPRGAHEINITHNGKVIPGIFRADRSSLQIIFGTAGSARPTTFDDVETANLVRARDN